MTEENRAVGAQRRGPHVDVGRGVQEKELRKDPRGRWDQAESARTAGDGQVPKTRGVPVTRGWQCLISNTQEKARLRKDRWHCAGRWPSWTWTLWRLSSSKAQLPGSQPCTQELGSVLKSLKTLCFWAYTFGKQLYLKLTENPNSCTCPKKLLLSK